MPFLVMMFVLDFRSCVEEVTLAHTWQVRVAVRRKEVLVDKDDYRSEKRKEVWVGEHHRGIRQTFDLVAPSASIMG